MVPIFPKKKKNPFFGVFGAFGAKTHTFLYGKFGHFVLATGLGQKKKKQKGESQLFIPL